MYKHILIIDEVPDFFIGELKSKGFKINHLPDESPAYVKGIIKDYTHILIRSSFLLNREIIEQAEQLQVILRPGSGLDSIDLEFAEKKGIKVINSPEGNMDAVAEHVIGLILALSKNIYRSFDEVKKGKWKREENRGFELKGKTLGLIGYGHTGSAVAEKVSGINLNVLAYDKYRKGFSAGHVKEVSLNKLLKHSNIISLHVPLSNETRYFADKDFLNQMQAGSYLINTSRGLVVNNYELLNSVRSGHIAGAALDVLETEPPLNDPEYFETTVKPLIDSGKVIITPHIAGWTAESKVKMYEVLLKKMFLRSMKKINRKKSC